MAGKRRKGRAASSGKKKIPAVSSLATLLRLLNAHASQEKLRVQVRAMMGIGEATSMRDLLRHQAEQKHWRVQGMKRLEALVKVDTMIAHCGGLLDQAIGHMEAVAAAANSIDPTDAEPVVPALGTEDTAAFELAERMLEAGMGLRSGPRIPSAALLDLAARTLHDEGPSGDIDIATDASATDIVEADPGVRCLAADGAVELAPAVRSLAAQDTMVASDGELLVPALNTRRLATEDKATLELAERMLEAGMGLCGGPLVPSADLLDLAARTLLDEGLSGHIDIATDHFETDIVEGDPAADAEVAPTERRLAAEDAVGPSGLVLPERISSDSPPRDLNLFAATSWAALPSSKPCGDWVLRSRIWPPIC